MYRYYQTTGKDPWKPIVCSSGDHEEEAKRQGACKLTILATNILVTEDTDRTTISHKGPLYFDIDMKEDLNLAISSTSKLVGRLQDMQVPDEAIEVYASGSKGMHVIVPEKVFSSGRQVKGLPYIYAEMALRLDVLGMDYQVYSGGQGVCWRLCNVKRDDGKYRVRITLEELLNLSAKTYLELVKSPRPCEFPTYSGGVSAGLAALFEQAKKAYKAKPRAQNVVADSALAKFKDEPPHCITDLLDYKVKQDAKFNAIAMQLAIFVARSGMADGEAFSSRLAKTGHSTQYSSERARESHTLGLVRYAKYRTPLKFSCPAVVSLLKASPCEGCPQATAKDDFLEGDSEVIEKPDGYFIPGEHRDKRLTNFTIDPIAVYLDMSKNGLSHRRAGALVEYKQNGVVVGNGLFNESGWKSKAGFKDQIIGIAKALTFTGHEDDVHRIMRLVMGNEDVDTVIQTYTQGIQMYSHAGRDIRVYTEPGYSVNQLSQVGTHNLTGSLQGGVSLKDADKAKPGQTDIDEIVSAMVKTNSPEIVAQILGWYVACHLRSHFMMAFKQFPFLSLWGNAGAGKSRTTDLFGWLCALDDMRTATSISLEGATAWPVIEFCSTSTTVPRILEEFNKSKIKPALYNTMCGVLKCSWDAQNLPRGHINGSSADGKGRTGAAVIQLPIEAPIVTIGEQAPEMAALQHRSVQVLLSTNSRSGRTDPFTFAHGNREKLKPLAKSLVISSLNTDVDWVRDAIDSESENVPDTLEDRPRYSYKVLLVGLEFLAKELERLKMYSAAEVRGLKEVLISHLSDTEEELSQSKKATEVDAVMKDMAMMAGMEKQGGKNWLRPNVEYVKKGDKIVIDVPIAHTLYCQYKRIVGSQVTIENTGQFIQLLAQESYFMKDKYPCEDLARGRGMTLLNIDKMRAKGILTEMFVEA